jgi:hypothetical protein
MSQFVDVISVVECEQHDSTAKILLPCSVTSRRRKCINTPYEVCNVNRDTMPLAQFHHC